MKEEKKQDHRTIAKELELYGSDERAGQGLPLLLPNWVIIRNKIAEFLQKKTKRVWFSRSNYSYFRQCRIIPN